MRKHPTRIPTHRAGHAHRSKKDYKRVKRVDVEEHEDVDLSHMLPVLIVGDISINVDLDFYFDDHLIGGYLPHHANITQHFLFVSWLLRLNVLEN